MHCDECWMVDVPSALSVPDAEPDDLPDAADGMPAGFVDEDVDGDHV